MESGHRGAKERERVQRHRPERGRYGGAPQKSETTPQPGGSSREGGSVARGQAEGIWPRARPACEDPVPVWECTPSSLGGSTPETWNGATAEKAAFSEPPTRSGTEVLGLEPAAPKGTGTPGRRREENPVQVTISKSKKSAKPTPDGEGRG
jgi:hypothetical protein